MCFHIHKRHKRIKTATEDIVCYKVFPRRSRTGNQHKQYVRSLFQEFKYELGETYYEDSITVNETYQEIYSGIHSYSTFTMAKERTYLHRIIVKCIIPAGAKYYYNPIRKEYVSDYITIGKTSDVLLTT